MPKNIENMNTEQIIGIDFDGLHIRLAKIKLGRVQVSSDFRINRDTKKDSIIQQLIEAINSLFDKNITGIGMGIPGVVDADNGIVYDTHRLPSWRGLNIKKMLEAEFNVPVYVNNDANCFVIGEKYFGKGQKYNELVGLTIGVGLGAGVVHDGRLLTGSHSGVGEIGRISYRDSNFEAYCSLQYFDREGPYSFEETLCLAENGDKKACHVFTRFGESVGNAVQMILYTFDPQAIIIGGPVSTAFPYFKDTLYESLKNCFNGNAAHNVKIELSEDPHIGLLGASALYHQEKNKTHVSGINSEKKAVEVQLHKSEEKYYRLFNQIADPIFVFDKKTYKFLDCNEEVVKRIYGYSKNDLHAMTPLDLHPPEELEKVSKRLRIKNKDVPFRYTHITKSGKRMDVEVLSDEIDYDGHVASMTIVRDISDRIKTEHALQRKATQTALLYKVGKHLSSQLELDRLLKDIVESIRNYFDYFGVMLLLLDKKGKKLQLKSIAGGYEKVFPSDLSIDVGEGMIGTAVSENRIQISGDVRTNPHYIKKAKEVTLSELSAPIVSGDKVIGVLDMQSDQLYAFDKGDSEVVSTLCSQISSAIQNAALYQKAQNELHERKQTQKALIKSRNNLQKSKRETDNILENVEEGLFTLNKRYIIASQYSGALSKIFEERNLAKHKLTDLLHGKIDFGVLNSTVEYLELMFNNDLDEKDIEELNPLTQVEFVNSESDKKYLAFNFRRIINNNRIIALFATVNDITEQINLAQRLEKSEAQSKRQMEWLLNIMHVEPELIREFIESAEREITHFRSILKTVNQNDHLNTWVDQLYRSVHLVKGNASLLDLTYFAHRAHDCEENLQIMRDKDSITPSDIIKLTRYIDEMQQSIDEMQGLIEKISQIHHHFRPKRTYETEKLIRSIGNFISNLSQDLDKKVNFDYSGFNGKALPHNYKLLVKDILIQLVRNALFHGIENESERRRMKKDPTGIIQLRAHKKNNSLEVIFRDDGRGLQIEKLRKTAEKMKLCKKTEIENWQDDQIAQIIFEPGVTTAEHCDLSAGRGVGMDLVREKIEKHKGKIKVESVSGKYCEFIISLPLNMNEEPIK